MIDYKRYGGKVQRIRSQGDKIGETKRVNNERERECVCIGVWKQKEEKKREEGGREGGKKNNEEREESEKFKKNEREK